MLVLMHRSGLLFGFMTAVGMTNIVIDTGMVVYDNEDITHAIYLPISYSEYRQITPAPTPSSTRTPTSIPTVPLERYPPMARLSIGDRSVESGVGSFCWWFNWIPGEMCADYFLSYATGHAPLVVPNLSEVHLNLAPQQLPNRISVIVMPLSSSDETRADVTPWWRWWNHTRVIMSHSVDVDRSPKISMDLKDGLYIAVFSVVWNDPDLIGDVEYGFLLEAKSADTQDRPRETRREQ